MMRSEFLIRLNKNTLRILSGFPTGLSQLRKHLRIRGGEDADNIRKRR